MAGRLRNGVPKKCGYPRFGLLIDVTSGQALILLPPARGLEDVPPPAVCENVFFLSMIIRICSICSA